jgi:hypothetical protein
VAGFVGVGAGSSSLSFLQELRMNTDVKAKAVNVRSFLDSMIFRLEIKYSDLDFKPLASCPL